MSETEISTPIETAAEDTSTIVEPETTDTSTAEPETTEIAETETGAEVAEQATEKLYAGKYKSIEDLEKGYSEAQKSVAKATEFEKKYNELLQKQQAEIERIAQQRLTQAQQRGFNSIEAQEIADKVQVAEFEYYANNLSQVAPEYYQEVQGHLLNYYNTGHKAYLDEAKRYFTSDFIERVANEKSRYESQLRGEYQAQQRARVEAQEAELAEILKANYADFLADVQENEGKAQALKSFCDVGSITSKEDMQVFHDIYNKIAKYERELAIKEYEASKAIEETKQRAVIEGVNNPILERDTAPTYADVQRMTQQEYNDAVAKWGLERILAAK
jgi:hypothetical protein